MPPLISESDLARACTGLLQLDGWRALKTDPVSRREWAKGFGERGMADYLYLRYPEPVAKPGTLAYIFRDGAQAAFCEAMWIEFKIPKGRVAPHQHQWRERERARGALALIAGVDFHASIEGFMKFYANSGLMRKRLELKK